MCLIFCARLDATAMGALLNVVAFAIKQLVHTIVYRGQLMVINTTPRIGFAAKLVDGTRSVSLDYGSVRRLTAQELEINRDTVKKVGNEGN